LRQSAAAHLQARENKNKKIRITFALVLLLVLLRKSNSSWLTPAALAQKQERTLTQEKK
jgi:hypothetical protein